MKRLVYLSVALALIACGKKDDPIAEKKYGAAIESKTEANAAPQEPGKTRDEITFKGIPFDKPGQKDAIAALCTPNPDSQSYEGYIKGCPTPKQIASGRFEFAVPFGSISFSTPHFRLAEDGSSLALISITSTTGEMLGMIEVLSQKYGPPLLETTEAQNGFGQKFEKKIAQWTDTRGTRILIKTRDRRVNAGSLTIESASTLAKTEAEIKASKEAASKNL